MTVQTLALACFFFGATVGWVGGWFTNDRINGADICGSVGAP